MSLADRKAKNGEPEYTGDSKHDTDPQSLLTECKI